MGLRISAPFHYSTLHTLNRICTTGALFSGHCFGEAVILRGKNCGGRTDGQSSGGLKLSSARRRDAARALLMENNEAVSSGRESQQ